jgi:methylated-DNA-[protein]-cysteine S-methyltransferase
MSVKLPSAVLNKIKTYPDFYQKVWLGCSRIPRGKTVTYSQLAAAIGHPGAQRAVGRALAKNPFAPTVPCHRVVAANGKIGGYSGPGGIKAKSRLLKRERNG